MIIILGNFIIKDVDSVYGIEKIKDNGIVVVNKREAEEIKKEVQINGESI